MLVCAGLFLAAAAWIAATGLLACVQLHTAEQTLRNLGDTRPAGVAQDAAGEVAFANPRASMRRAARCAAQAHELTTGPVWFLASRIPYAGAPLRIVRGTTEIGDRLVSEALSPLADIATRLVARPGADAGHLDLTVLRGAGAALTRSSVAAAEARAAAESLPHRTWLPAADHLRTQLSHAAGTIASVLAQARTAARALPAALGANGDRHYLVVLQNTAEARGTGGIPGAFAELTLDRGEFALGNFGNDTAMGTVHTTLDLGPDYTAMYGRNGPARTWGNSDLSPDFPAAARIWAAAWRVHTGRSPDGVIALDPTALAPLLSATGPAHLPNGTTVSGSDVVDLTERASYALYPDTAARKAFFLTVARACARSLLRAGDVAERPGALLRAVRSALAGGHVHLWSAHADEQRVVVEHGLSGALPEGPEPFGALVVNNAAGTKLDYYLDRDLTWTAARSTAGGRAVTVRVTLSNRAPATGLPRYVTHREDAVPYPTRPGDNRLLVTYFATAGANLCGATLEGDDVLLQPGAERGHPTFSLALELPVRASRTLVLRLLEPPSDSAPQLLRQPLVRPLRVTVAQASSAAAEGFAGTACAEAAGATER